MSKRMLRWMLALCLCLLLVPAARPAVVLVSDQRGTDLLASASHSIGGGQIDIDTQNDAPAPAFAPFTSALTGDAQVNQPGGPGVADANSDATQQSAVTPNLMTFAGTARGDSSTTFSGSGVSQNTSRFSVTFNLTTPETYTLSGTLDAFRSHGNNGNQQLVASENEVKLVGSSSTVFSSALNNPGPGLTQQTIVNNQTGLLPAGQYTLTARSFNATIAANNNPTPRISSSGGYNFTFTLTPEPGTAALLALGAAATLPRRRRAAH